MFFMTKPSWTGPRNWPPPQRGAARSSFAIGRRCVARFWKAHVCAQWAALAWALTILTARPAGNGASRLFRPQARTTRRWPNMCSPGCSCSPEAAIAGHSLSPPGHGLGNVWWAARYPARCSVLSDSEGSPGTWRCAPVPVGCGSWPMILFCRRTHRIGKSWAWSR